MVMIRKKKYAIYRQFEQDVWGYYANNNPEFNIPKYKTKITKFFHMLRREEQERLHPKKGIHIYRIDLYDPKRKIKRRKWRFVSLRVLKFFYISLSHRHFRRYGRLALRQNGTFSTNYLFFLEGRLASMLYRMRFIQNVFILKQFIVYGHVIVGKRLQTFPNYNVKLHEIVWVVKNKISFVRTKLISRFIQNLVYFNVPRYIIINYKLFFGYMCSKPNLLDISFPMSIDVYRGMDYL